MFRHCYQKIVLTSHRLAAFRSQCQWIRIFVVNCSVWGIKMYNKQCASHSWLLTPLWQWGLNLDLNGIEKVIIQHSVLENYGFDTYQWLLFITLRLKFISDIPKTTMRHQCWSSIIFMCYPFQRTPISLLRVHLNGIGNITIHLNATSRKTMNFILMLAAIVLHAFPPPSQRWVH